MDMASKTAGIIVIGDEILKGHTRDTNSSFFLSQLWSLGVKVEKVSFIPDDVDEIAKEVADFSAKYSFVFTSGGIGPTHDDVTISGIAQAFNEPLENHPEMNEILQKLCALDKTSFNDSILKMAMLPNSARLKYPQDSNNKDSVNFPLINVQNVYIFPGIPEYLEKSFFRFSYLFHAPEIKFYLYKLYISLNESEIAEALTEVDATFRENLHLGSYPCVDELNYKVKVTLESGDQSRVEAAYEHLLRQLPTGSILHVKKYSPNSRETYQEVFKPGHRACRLNSITEVDQSAIQGTEELLQTSNHSHLSSAVKTAWAVLNETLNQYELNEICIGFNGGKDCTVALHLWLVALKKRYPRFQEKPIALYIKNEAPFPEAEQFIKQTAMSYNLDLIIIRKGMREALETLQSQRPGLKACLMGTRRHDPYSAKLRSFSPTDGNWPRFMRILPILDWSYEEIWEYIKTLSLPYCSLYDQGYTSLGSQENTHPNPLLLNNDGTYLPAFYLRDESRERDGRD